MSRRAFLWFAATCTLFAADTGIRPRGTPSEYPAYQTTSGITLAAAVLTPEQVHKRFATDLNRGYVVVEVAVYPEAGRDVTLAERDFLLRFASDPATERPLSAQTIAAKLGPKDDREPTGCGR